jgi:hypothetical protein
VAVRKDRKADYPLLPSYRPITLQIGAIPNTYERLVWVLEKNRLPYTLSRIF